MLPKCFRAYVEQTPIAVLVQASLESLFQAEDIDQLFRDTAQQQYQHEILFSTLTDLMLAVVLQEQPSVYAAYRHFRAQGRLTVAAGSLYEKLQHVELDVSAALVHYSAERVAPVLKELHALEPSWLPDWRIRLLDGTHLAGTEHRLDELRTTWAGALPGTVLAVLDQQSQLVTDVFLTPDGHAQERSLLDDVLEQIRERDLWIADRNFCTLKFLFGIDRAGAAFVIRQHGTLVGRLLGKRRKVGRTETGRVYEQTIALEFEGRQVNWRRVTVLLDQPTSDGDTEIHILTNLTKTQATACEVAELYRRRWTIEGRFYEVTQTLNCEPQTLGYPQAALFAFCLALLASNAVALVKGALRSAHGTSRVSNLSVYYLTLEVQQTHRGMMVALPAAKWRFLRELTAAELAADLKEIAKAAQLPQYAKSERGPKKPPPPRKRYSNGEHVSTHQLLKARKE